MTDTRVHLGETFAIAIVQDTDHASYVAADIRRETDPDTLDMLRDELAKLEAYDWTAYGTVLVRVCGCCGHDERDYSHALWGTVVDTSCDLLGTYSDPAAIADEHLRDVAREILAEVTR